MTRYLIVLLAAFTLAACAEPAGPIINTSGDSNNINVVGDESSENDVIGTPPVVITPVVIAPESEEPA